MDIIIGSGNKDVMLTLVERNQGYFVIARQPKGKDANGTAKGHIQGAVIIYGIYQVHHYGQQNGI